MLFTLHVTAVFWWGKPIFKPLELGATMGNPFSSSGACGIGRVSFVGAWKQMVVMVLYIISIY